MVTSCPKGLAPEACCAVTKHGNTFIHKLATCRAAMLSKGGEVVLSRRVAIRKSDDGGPPGMTTSEEWQRINLRKVSDMLIEHLAKNYQRARPELKLSDAQARVKIIEQYPRLPALYDEGHRRGDAPEELMPPAPVAKASGRTKGEVLAEIERRAAALVEQRGAGLTLQHAIVEVVTKAAPELYDEYNAARHAS